MGPATLWRARLPQVPRGPAEPVALEIRDYPVRGVQTFRFDSAFPATTTNHHFALETWSDLLRRAGFVIERLGEPRPSPALVRRDKACAPYVRALPSTSISAHPHRRLHPALPAPTLPRSPPPRRLRDRAARRAAPVARPGAPRQGVRAVRAGAVFPADRGDDKVAAAY